MRIGELARRSGVSTRTLRHYEGLGLLHADRETNGYRVYTDRQLRLVEEIRDLVQLGFALEETRPFLDCLTDGNELSGSCPDSKAMYRRKLAEVDGYLDRLARIRAELRTKLATSTETTQTDPHCIFTPTRDVKAT